MNKIYLIENHDQALKVWQRKNIQGLDLVHLDAHMDFEIHPAKPIEKIIQEAKGIKDLKEKLEYTLSFLHYEKDLCKQTDIGNYIYPAIQEDMIKNFYWVVPGRKEEFKESSKTIKNMLKEIIRYEDNKGDILEDKDGVITAECLGRKFMVCSLDNLPVIAGDALLDIDTDFLVIDSVLNAENTRNIRKRKPWVLPKDLVPILKEKIKTPKIITIAYSVNGGFTPISYRYLADELAYSFAPFKFKRRLAVNYKAAQYFHLFNSTGKKEYYHKAVRLNPAYGVIDNNYGPLYLFLRRFSRAEKEFRRILKADPKNPNILSGLGEVALERGNLKEARRCFQSALRFTNHQPFFKEIKKEIHFNLGRAEFGLKNFYAAKKLLLVYRRLAPLNPQSYYLLGYIFEKERKFLKAALLYQDALRLGKTDIEVLLRLMRISSYLKDKNKIKRFILSKYRQMKKEFMQFKKSYLKKKKKIGLKNVEQKFLALKKKLKLWCSVN